MREKETREESTLQPREADKGGNLKEREVQQTPRKAHLINPEFPEKGGPRPKRKNRNSQAEGGGPKPFRKPISRVCEKKKSKRNIRFNKAPTPMKKRRKNLGILATD